jgi:8-oxo-dGTP pyrophosphatase MutT (NUDIX family)
VSKEKLFYVGVKALIENTKGQILLLKSPGWKAGKIDPHWDIPGGRIQEGGGVLATLKREVKEETGIAKVTDEQFFTSVISNHETKKSGATLGLVLMIYRVNVPALSRVKLSAEHTDYEWVDKKEAAKRLKHKYPEELTKALAS